MHLAGRVTSSRLLSSLIISAAVIVVAGSIGVADSPVTYNGCENVATGLTRLLNNTNLPPPWNKCLEAAVVQALHLNPALTEVPVSWNQQGPQGIQGATGAKGDTGATGSTGSAGANGHSVLNGLGAPGSAVGSVGDFYIDTAANALYGPKGSGGWPASGVSLVGPNGNTGAAGAQGAPGPQGPPGPQGAQGPAGAGLASLDALAGLPCNLGGGNWAGTIAISFDNAGSHGVTMTCVPGNQSLTVTPTALDAGGATTKVPTGARITSTPAGISCPPTCSAGYPFNTAVTLTATAPTGFGFAGYSGACSGASCSVSMAGPRAVTATFRQDPTITLTVAAQNLDGTPAAVPVGAVVSSQPAGIQCPGTCSTSFAFNSAVTLTVTVPTEWSVLSWGGGLCTGNATTCSFTATSNQASSVTLIHGFRLALRVVGVVLGPGSGFGGTVTPSVGTTLFQGCSDFGDVPFVDCFYYFVGDSVTLTESTGQAFESWSGDCSGTAPTCVVIMNQAHSVTATFMAAPGPGAA
jgi:hypothetical protein